MSEPQHPDILLRLTHFCCSPDLFVREEISGGYVRDMLRDARDEITRLRLTDAELRAVRTAAFAYSQNDDDPECAEIASALLGLAERRK